MYDLFWNCKEFNLKFLKEGTFPSHISVLADTGFFEDLGCISGMYTAHIQDYEAFLSLYIATSLEYELQLPNWGL